MPLYLLNQMKQDKKTSTIFKFFSILVLLNLIACSSIAPYKVPILQGNIFEEEEIEKLSVGLSKEQVQFILGTALIKDPFHSNRWDYYYSVQVGENLVNQKKLSVNFDSNSLLDSWTLEELEN